jgi:hypothetical protein
MEQRRYSWAFVPTWRMSRNAGDMMVFFLGQLRASLTGLLTWPLLCILAVGVKKKTTPTGPLLYPYFLLLFPLLSLLVLPPYSTLPTFSLSRDYIGLLLRDPDRRGSACSPWRGGRGSLLPAPVAAAPSSRRGAPRGGGGGGGSEAQRPRLPPRRPSPTPAALAPLPGAAWRRGGFRTRRLPSGVACPTRWLPDARRLPSPPPTRWLPNAAAPLPYLDANDEDVRLSEFVHGHEIGERMTGRSHMSSSARMDLGSMF